MDVKLMEKLSLEGVEPTDRKAFQEYNLQEDFYLNSQFITRVKEKQIKVNSAVKMTNYLFYLHVLLHYLQLKKE